MSELPLPTDDRERLSGFLDWYRGVAEHKLAGLTLEQTTAVATPSGVTMLGIIKHLAWDERGWFEYSFAGGPDAGAGVSSEASFHIEPGDTLESVFAEFHAATAVSREIVAAAPSLAAPAAVRHDVFGVVDLGWILVHVIEETARHCGHLDILRELTDGSTGD